MQNGWGNPPICLWGKMDKLDFTEIEDAALSTGATVELTGLQVAILLSLVDVGMKRWMWTITGERPTASQWDAITAELSAIENILLS